MVKLMQAAQGMCQSGNVPNCHFGRLVSRPDPLNPPETEEELSEATLRINAILESLNPPPGGLGEGYIEVFSTDWSFGAGQDERCFGDGADSLRAQSDAVENLPAGLEQRDPALSFGA
jgi:hypothetical protein